MNIISSLTNVLQSIPGYLQPDQYPSNPPWLDYVLKIIPENFMPTHLLSQKKYKLLENDYKILNTFKTNIIEGFLNLSKAQGWHEGHDPRVGIAFVRYTLIHYFAQKKGERGANTQVFKRSIKAFTTSKPLLSPPLQEDKPQKYHPKKSRLRYDLSVNGWQDHAISRLVGNVGSAFRPEAPFFEILVNSSRDSAEKTSCQPFHISVFKNGSEIDERQNKLQRLKTTPGDLAHFTFYSPNLQKPDAFLRQHQKQLGPNSTHLLKGLAFLQNVTINSQTVGNCWMKQPMRALLATLYVEVLTQQPNLTPEKAWETAKALYKNIQKTEAIPLVESFLGQVQITDTMKKAALESLEHHKKL